jgi:chemotaxis family two-component system response regulator Rcp1
VCEAAVGSQHGGSFPHHFSKSEAAAGSRSAVGSRHRLKDEPMQLGIPIDLLLVEDEPGDVRLTMEAFHHRGALRLHHAWNGVEAIAFLKREHSYAHAPRPDLIIMDLNMPQMGGKEALALIKSDPDLKSIPTIIFTSTDSETDILACYVHGANCCLRKPSNWEDFDSLLKSIDNFWLTRAKLPGRIAATLPTASTASI